MNVKQSNEPNADYHDDTSHVSASMLKTFHYEGPRVYEAKYVTRTLKQEPSPAMEFGTALHTLFLEGATEFDDQYRVASVSDRRTKAWKDMQRIMQETGDDRQIITQKDMDRLNRCAESLFKHKLINAIHHSEGIVEHSFRWESCKFRPDKLCTSTHYVFDLKTTARLNADSFAKSIADFGYHIQASHYCAGARAYVNRPWRMIFGVVETQEPYRAHAYVLANSAVEIADTQRDELLAEIAYRTADNNWEEPAEGEAKLVDLPDWYYRKHVTTQEID